MGYNKHIRDGRHRGRGLSHVSSVRKQKEERYGAGLSSIKVTLTSDLSRSHFVFPEVEI